MAKWSLEEEKEALDLYGATNRDISATDEIWRFFQQSFKQLVQSSALRCFDSKRFRRCIEGAY